MKRHGSYIKKEAKDQGSYILILDLKRSRKIPVGKLGGVSFRRGFYIYVGSAMANLSKRIERHRHLRKKHHWHIDELRAVADFHSTLAIRSSVRLECEIAEALSKISEWAIPGFGCTDCSCDTHLFGFKNDPLQLEKFQKLLKYFYIDRYLSGNSLLKGGSGVNGNRQERHAEPWPDEDQACSRMTLLSGKSRLAENEF